MELLSLLVMYLTWPSIADGDEVDEDCRFGYYTNSGEYEESYISCGINDYCCGHLMDRNCCINPENNSNDDDDSPTIGLMFGSIAACTIFIVLCACICGKMVRRQPPSTEQPYTDQTNSPTGGGSHFSSLTNQTNTSDTSTSIQVTPSSIQMRDPAPSPPPSYEECLEKNLILPPPAYDALNLFTNNAYSGSDSNVTANTVQIDHNHSPANSD
ncbi:uncharacterized protein LOC132550726 [Ylistrum balloti]|uniref:uncharacterized protein LOC132550726 n=1 Tax=Ylistrum balloti TaxID=509963 RepID=UPI0029057F37|nr:uncharacterized protein LOC132550726 [Ylistrum balloti]